MLVQRNYISPNVISLNVKTHFVDLLDNFREISQ